MVEIELQHEAAHLNEDPVVDQFCQGANFMTMFLSINYVQAAVLLASPGEVGAGELQPLYS